MNGEYIIRKATTGDTTFIAKTIIAAEKSGSDKLGLSTLFDLPEEEIEKLLLLILAEESSGSEFSMDSFLIAEYKGNAVSAIAGWIENFGEHIPSRMIKTNLIHFIFPTSSIFAAHLRADIVKEIYIERQKNTLQIDYAYTASGHRGRGLPERLINQHKVAALKKFPGLEKMQSQVLKNNLPAIKMHIRCGFSITQSFKSYNKDILKYLPGDEKLLMEKIIE